MKNPFKRQKESLVDKYDEMMEDACDRQQQLFKEMEREKQEYLQKMTAATAGIGAALGPNAFFPKGNCLGGVAYYQQAPTTCPVDKALYVVNVGGIDVPKYHLCLLADNIFFDVASNQYWSCGVVAGWDKYPMDEIAHKWLAAMKEKA